MKYMVRRNPERENGYLWKIAPYGHPEQSRYCNLVVMRDMTFESGYAKHLFECGKIAVSESVYACHFADRGPVIDDAKGLWRDAHILCKLTYDRERKEFITQQGQAVTGASVFYLTPTADCVGAGLIYA